jgi:N-acetyl-gamma-glutamyl-phosphate reductase
MLSTSLINVRRGIIAGLYARLAAGVDPAQAEAAIAQAYADAYKGYGLARVTALNAKNERRALSLKTVVGTARVHIAYKLVGDKLFVHSLIDNLLKGAAGQAVENFNRLHDLSLETGIKDLEGVL